MFVRFVSLPFFLSLSLLFAFRRVTIILKIFAILVLPLHTRLVTQRLSVSLISYLNSAYAFQKVTDCTRELARAFSSFANFYLFFPVFFSSFFFLPLLFYVLSEPSDLRYLFFFSYHGELVKTSRDAIRSTIFLRIPIKLIRAAHRYSVLLESVN